MIKETEHAMQNAIEASKKNFSGIRTGRANPALIEKLAIDYYGATMPLKQLASISVPEGRQLLITPFDKTTVPAIEKAILTSDLGVSPQTGSDTIRLILPPLTEERRKSLIKLVRQHAEDGRVSIRNARHVALDKIKKQEKDKAISEDDSRSLQEEVQKLTDKYTKDIDRLTHQKEAEVMEP